MKHHAAGVAFAFACLLAPVAQAADATSAFHPLIGFGLTGGGEKLATVTYSTPSGTESESIRSGGLISLYGGGEYRFTPQVSLQATFGYQIDDTSGEDASLRFSRYPIELLGHYAVSDLWRLGGGVRVVTNVKMRGSGQLSYIAVPFDNTTGLVLEAEYFTGPNASIKLRGVSERYRPSRGGPEVDGSHIGLMLNVYF